LANVRVIPVDARVGKVHAIYEAAARRHWLLREIRGSIERIVEAHTVPVNSAGQIDAIAEAHRDLGILRHANERARDLAVEAVHREGSAFDRAPHEHRREVERVTILE